MDHKQFLTDTFPIGVKYAQHRDMQEKYWDRDFANMRDCGVDAIRLHAFWAPLEPREGEFDFAQYDRICEKAGQYGVKIMFTLYMMASPEWIFHKHPDSRFVSAAGTVWNSNQTGDNAHGGWPGLCWDSKPFRQTVENFVGAFVTHYKGNPNVLAIDIWHEPTDEAATHGPENDWKEVMMCYCPHSIAAFKDWLREKYGTLEKLNQVWTRHFNSWEEVQPPRNMGTYTDWLDWKTFRLDAISDQVHWLGQIVKKYDPDRSTSVHVGILEMGHPITHADDHFRLADATDMFACSMYEAKKPDLGGFTSDLMRSACDNGPYWIGETGTGSGPIFSFFGADPDQFHCFARNLEPEEIFRLSWSQIARGAKGIFYWAWRPDLSTIEHLSLGFTERNGDLTDRTAGLKEFTSTVRQYKDKLAKAFAPKSRLCILYNMDSMIIEGIASIGRTASGFVDFNGTAYKDMISFIGLYRLCLKNGIQPDFISKEQMDAGKLSDYEYLILPYSISVTTPDAAAIEQFVAEGGTVISDAMLGFFTDEGWGSEVCPPQGLDKVFGLSTSGSYDLVKYTDVILDAPETDCGKPFEAEGAPGNCCEASAGGKSLCLEEVGRFVQERIRPQEGTQIHAHFPDGRPAIVTNTYGKGRTVYLGTVFFATVMKKGMAQTNPLFRELLKLAGYQNDKQITGAGAEDLIEVRRLASAEGEFIFVINQTDFRQNVKVEVENVRNGSVLEIRSGKTCGQVSDGIFRFEGQLAEMDVKVFYIA